MKSYSAEDVLWADVLSGDLYAYEYLYTSYVARMFTYGHKLTDDGCIVEDGIQEVFINIIQNRNNLSKKVNLKPYLFKALRLEIWRSLKKEKNYLAIDDLEFTSDLNIEDNIVDDEVTMIRVNEIRKELNLLPKRQKEAIYLRYYEGMNYNEISEVMNLEQSSSYKIIYKAIDALYQKLSSKKGKLFY